jgi:O-antigen ligase
MAAGSLLDTRLTTAFAGLIAVTPFLLIHARGVAEGLFGAIAVIHVLRCARDRDFSGFRQPWVVAGLAYWAWLVLSTLVNRGTTEQLIGALAWGRMPITVLALSTWVLAAAEARRWLFWGTGLSLAWVALEIWLQLLFGRGILGFRRWPAGELPGPFTRPRAGHYLGFAMWGPVIATAGGLLARKDVLMRLGGGLVLGLAVATVIFAGQRMPVAFTLLGLLVAGVLLPAMRLPVAAAIGAGTVALVASSFVAPGAFHRIAVQFFQQVANFKDTHYGQILARGLEMVRQHPVLGLGEGGFQTYCREPVYHVGWVAGSDGGGAAICVTHAHNHYLQALTDGGIPGLLLFAAMAVLVVLAAGRGLLRAPTPLRVGLFLGAALPFWPLASGTAFTNMPIAGVWLLMAGWALAEARAADPPREHAS